MPIIRREEGERETLLQASKLMLVSLEQPRNRRYRRHLNSARKGKTSTLTGGDVPRKLPFSGLDKGEVKTKTAFPQI